jgi:homoserine O-succinyltransferase
MPVLVDRGPAGCTIVAKERTAQGRETRRTSGRAEWIEIGLVNNMPDAALEATEQQFVELLRSAAGEAWVRLRFFSLPGIARSARAKSYLGKSYGDAVHIRKADLDGLIVTGTEPKAANLKDEPYWRPFTQLVDWAAGNTISAVWSCLAAHAAVLHLDGIERVPLGEKCIGVFDCETATTHALTESLPARSAVPHARWNALREEALRRSGYEILTRSPSAGVDAFVRQEQSLFLFLQGHPEYGAPALLSEFRRDVGRFLKGERADYPAMPRHYFDAATEAALAEFAARAKHERSEGLLAEFPIPADVQLTAHWQPFAVAIYRNWLALISAQKRRQMRPAQYLAALRLDQAPAPAI